MPRLVPALVAAFLSSLVFSSTFVGASARGVAAALPSPLPTKPPQIYYVVTRPICAQLQHTIAPAVGMLLQDDQDIAKSPPIFNDYIRNAFLSSSSSSPYDSTNYSSAGRDMALQRMEQLVPSLAQNVIGVQKIIESLSKPTGDPADDARLKAIHEELLKAVAMQSVSLDLINGFVQTQQLGDIQHAGEEFLSSINATETTGQTTPPPNALDPFSATMQDPNAPGLPPNPYSVDVAAMPGLAVGYNPVSRVVSVLDSVREETTAREKDLANSVGAVATLCGVNVQHSP
ncbi:MAG TPA: hypothetical protein VFE16_04835 [Candidatus Cybelea sp.]|jgi:hypothetical protein|nr:hypothetical protein [Candidatus Cybelea sp.]